MKTIAFTAHRKYNQKGNRLLKQVIIRALNKGIYRYISGLAPGGDREVINILDDLREKYPEIYIIGARPFDAHGRNKYGEFYADYKKCLDKCDEIVLVSEGEYHVSMYHIRNHWMVDNANYLVALLDDRNEGGAYKICFKSKEESL